MGEPVAREDGPGGARGEKTEKERERESSDGIEEKKPWIMGGVRSRDDV